MTCDVSLVSFPHTACDELYTYGITVSFLDDFCFNILRESDFDFKTTHTHLLEIVLFGSYICYQIDNYVNNRYFNLDRCTFVKKILGELCCKANILHYNKTALEG